MSGELVYLWRGQALIQRFALAWRFAFERRLNIGQEKMSRHIHSRVGILLVGCLLAPSSGCGQRTPAVSDETTHHSPLTTHQPDEQFPFPADREGRLLVEKLQPSDQMPPLADEKRIDPKRQSGPAKLENPDVPLPAVTVSQPASILLEKSR